jgi:hypothetical protein
MASFEEWYKSVPLVTRTYVTLCFLTTMAVQLEFVSPLQLYLNFNAIRYHYQVRECFDAKSERLCFDLTTAPPLLGLCSSGG